MSTVNASKRFMLPSVDRILRLPAVAGLEAQYGRALVTDVTRDVLSALRESAARGGDVVEPTDDAIVQAVVSRVARQTRPSLVPVFNLTGTVLHTNLGRAALPREAIEAVAAVSAGREQPGIRPREGGARRPRQPYRRPAVQADRRRGRDRRQQQCGGRSAGAQHAGPAQGSAGIARRADRDRRRLPDARHHGARRLQAPRGRHDQPYPSEGLRGARSARARRC